MEETAQSAADALRAEALRAYGAQAALAQLQAASETSGEQWGAPLVAQSEVTMGKLDSSAGLRFLATPFGGDGADSRRTACGSADGSTPSSDEHPHWTSAALCRGAMRGITQTVLHG
jgi:hypothetical protein